MGTVVPLLTPDVITYQASRDYSRNTNIVKEPFADSIEINKNHLAFWIEFLQWARGYVINKKEASSSNEYTPFWRVGWFLMASLDNWFHSNTEDASSVEAITLDNNPIVSVYLAILLMNYLKTHKHLVNLKEQYVIASWYCNQFVSSRGFFRNERYVTSLVREYIAQMGEKPETLFTKMEFGNVIKKERTKACKNHQTL